MRETGMTANAISFRAAAEGCVKGGKWDQSSALSHAMRIMAANVIGFSAPISLCEMLLHKIREVGLTGNVIRPHHMLGAWQYRHGCPCNQLQ